MAALHTQPARGGDIGRVSTLELVENICGFQIMLRAPFLLRMLLVRLLLLPFP